MNNIIRFVIVCLISCLLVGSNSLDIKVATIESPTNQKQLIDLNNLRVAINSNNHYIYPSHKSTFTLPLLPAGRHIVEVISNVYTYPLLKIDKNNKKEPTYTLLHPFTRERIKDIYEPIIISPLDKTNYFFTETGFSLTGFLFSGTGLFVLFGGLLYFCYKTLMPKLEEAQKAPTD